MDKKHNYTILTAPPTENEINKERVNILCEAWLESIQSGSISYMSASQGLKNTLETCSERGYITEEYAHDMKKRYLPLFLDHIDSKALKNGKPSGFVKIAEDSEEILKRKGFKSTIWEPEKSLYREVERMFAEYGVKKNGKPFGKGGIRSWIEG